MSPREIHLLEARRRARSEVMRRAAIQRVLFELREALRAPKRATQ
jgi:predicted PP-loop superfamily ATPase